ncbi:hypothetical protein BB8028_0002g01410 [Beauveria bassiana]|uniref:Uncharacterized protein n=1 Tax=Beauveria bassiana TaxID=176275 RepID=A0A2S7Y0Y0_BEABA|nr:hypothetical protein BB8028_0002g01410 [Beauveria bassiana]
MQVPTPTNRNNLCRFDQKSERLLDIRRPSIREAGLDRHRRNGLLSEERHDGDQGVDAVENSCLYWRCVERSTFSCSQLRLPWSRRHLHGKEGKEDSTQLSTMGNLWSLRAQRGPPQNTPTTSLLSFCSETIQMR